MMLGLGLYPPEGSRTVVAVFAKIDVLFGGRDYIVIIPRVPRQK